MFPTFIFIFSFVILLGMIIYRVDEIRLNEDKEQIKKQLGGIKIVRRVRRGIDVVIYFVGIRIFRLIRKIKKRFKKKN